MRRLLASGLVLTAILWAQAPPKAALQMPVDEAAYKKALAIAEPPAQLAAILQFLSDYPNSRSVPLMINRAFLAAAKVGPWNAPRAVEFAGDIAKRLAKSSPMARSEAARTIRHESVQQRTSRCPKPNATPVRQPATSIRTTSSPANAIGTSKRSNLFTARDPKYKPIPFYPEEAREKYAPSKPPPGPPSAASSSNRDRDAEARQALQKSLAAARTADAAGAFAELAAKQGDTHTVLDALGTAILTGKADRSLVEKFQTAYREAAMRPDPEAWLDRRYRLESRNPSIPRLPRPPPSPSAPS